MKFDLNDKIAIVTGGSRGIGEMIAAGFLANGTKVYITARKAPALIEKANELSQKYNAECIAIPCDLSTKDGVDDFVHQIADKENGKISDDAIELIARTSEGSVRDSISLLDRALVSQPISENKFIEDTDVREMLGLADKSKVISLFKEVLKVQPDSNNYKNLATAYRNTGNLEESYQCFSQAIKYEPSDRLFKCSLKTVVSSNLCCAFELPELALRCAP